MISQNQDVFYLATAHTAYLFRVTQTGHLEHLYYGRKIREPESADALQQSCVFAPGNTSICGKEHGNFSLEHLRLEMSSYGKGDIREPFIEVRHADGSITSDFRYDHCEIRQMGEDTLTDRTAEPVADESSEMSGDEAQSGASDYALPRAYGEDGKLVLYLRDRAYGLVLRLEYCVYEACDVITRRSVLCNESQDRAEVQRLMSLQLDLDGTGYVISTFGGEWTKEMRRTDTHLEAGKYVNASYTGTSSSRANPFIMLGREETTEQTGICYGMNLIYSGNHYEALEVSSRGTTRIVTGMNPQSFSYLLLPGEAVDAPEAVMTFSAEGYGEMSRRMHRFVREHIVRGIWQYRERPVLLNSWEAAYFDISENKLLKLAAKAKEAGVELFVMDDGWFGEREDDTKALGDWEPNRKKLPGGVKRLADKITAMGLAFGIWVEPEMVSCDSRLYRQHPDWTIEIPGKPHAEGRNQRILDLCNRQVQDYVIEAMSELFESAEITYVKWDMNRNFTDVYAASLPAERQGEVQYRYYLGLYRCMRLLTERFPQILFEGCASGGNRFDLGILCYFPQIWASDNTDAYCRAICQQGYSYGYPLSVIGAHVSSCPNHQTLRRTPLSTRFHVAAFGLLGYECNFSDIKKEELQEIREQIEVYIKWRKTLQFGTFYRGRSLEKDHLAEWTCVSEDRERAAGFLMQDLAQPGDGQLRYYPQGLDTGTKYHFSNRQESYDLRDFGDLVNTVAPVHIRQDSLIHGALAHFVKLHGEQEELVEYGDLLMYGGAALKQAYNGTGFQDGMRVFGDFASRLYFMEKIEKV